MREIHSSLGGGTRVTVSDPKWPVLCACCCAPATTTVRIEFDDTNDKGVVDYLASWPVPYCKDCAEHVQKAEELRTRTAMGSSFFGSALSVLVVCWLVGILLRTNVPAVVAALGIAGVTAYRNGRRLV